MLLPAQFRLPMRTMMRLGIGALLGPAVLFAGRGSSMSTAMPFPSTTSLSGTSSIFDNSLLLRCSQRMQALRILSRLGIPQVVAAPVYRVNPGAIQLHSEFHKYRDGALTGEL